ncbi:porin family protein [Persicobacter psychrovividus]
MKNAVLFFIFFLFTFHLQAQGLRAGLNVSNISDLNTKSTSGLSIGYVLGSDLDDKIHLQYEFNYDQLGAVKQGSGANDDYVITYNCNYLTTALTAKFFVVEGLYFQAGPQISYLLKKEAEKEGDFPEEEFDMDNISSFPISFMGGIGYQYKNIALDARYSLGILDVTHAMSGNETATKYQNRVFQLSFGVYM